METPSVEMWRALLDFRARHGRYWKRALSLRWMNGGGEVERHSASLRMLRNNFGPSWLYNLRPATLDAMQQQIIVHDALPEMCATRLAGTGEAIVVKRGETGYWPIPDGMTVDQVNAAFGATPPVIAAMEAGSMFGWAIPGADPGRYDAEGRPRRSGSGDR